MANQPAPRPWIRLGSMRPLAPAPAPAPAPAAASPAPEAQPQAQAQAQPQPQPPAARPIIRPAFGQPFRPTTQPQQPPPSAAAAPPFRLGTVSVPTSPIQKTTTSVPTSPVVTKPSGTSSVPTSPVQKAVTTSAFPATILSSVPTSPVLKSPKPKTSASSSSVPTSPTTKVISTIPTTTTTTTTTSTTTVITESVTVPAPAPEPAPEQAPAPAPEPAPALARAPAPLFFKLPAKTTPPSEKVKPQAPPPSPLTLPPAQARSAPEPIEQKTVVIEKPKSPFKPSIAALQKDVGDALKPRTVPDYEKREPGTKDQKGNLKKADSEDASLKVITLAGDNTGAVMELSPARKKPDPEGNSKKTDLKTWLGTKLRSDSSSSDEETSKKKDKAHNKMGTPSPPMNAFMNSNVQAVNNSILFNTSCTHHDPGVHVFFTRRAGGRGLHLKDRGDGQDK